MPRLVTVATARTIRSTARPGRSTGATPANPLELRCSLSFLRGERTRPREQCARCGRADRRGAVPEAPERVNSTCVTPWIGARAEPPWTTESPRENFFPQLRARARGQHGPIDAVTSPRSPVDCEITHSQSRLTPTAVVTASSSSGRLPGICRRFRARTGRSTGG
jgi:hypothetical protein